MRILPAALFLSIAVGLSAAPPFRVALVGAPISWAALGAAGEKAPGPLVLAVTDGLVTFDPATGFAVPGLASAWTVDDSGKLWSFRLKAAKWSDGSPLTAKDVAEAWKKAGVKAVLSSADPKVLKAVFAQPVSGPAEFGAPPFLLFPDPVTGKTAGPFVAEAPENGTLGLVRNPAFRDAKAVKLARLEFRFVPTLDEASALFRDGLADWVPRGGGPGTLVPPGLRHLVSAPGWGLVFLRFNLHSPRLGDGDYRRSLAEALDRKAVAQGLRGPLLVPWASLVPGVTVPVLPPLPKPFGPHPEPVLTLVYPQGETYRSIALEVADQWKRRLGLVVSTKALTYPQIREARDSGAYEVALSSWLGESPDPQSFLGLVTSGSPENDTGYADPAYDQRVTSLRSLAPGKAREAVGQALVRAAEEAPLVPLLSYAWVNQIDLRRWTGWSANPTDIHPWVGVGPKK